MPKTVNFEGKSYNFPDDATDDEIFSFLEKSSRPSAEDRFSSAAIRRVGENLNPLPALRAIGGALTDKRGPTAGVGDLAVDAIGGILSPLKGMPEAARMAGRGEFGAAVGQAMESLPIVGPVIKRADDLERSGDLAGAFGSLTGDIATLGLTEGAGAAMRGAARVPARALTGGDTAVATAALENRALPGIIRSGPSRADMRLRRVESDITQGLKGPSGQVPISAQDLRRGAATDAEWSRIKAHRSRGPLEAEARQLQMNAPSDVPTNAAADVFERARQSRASGSTGMAAALDTDQISAVGRAVPSVAPMTSRANAIQSVRDSYRGNGGHGMVSAEGVPNMQARLLVSTLNRAAGPVTQGVYNTGKALSSDAIRAAVVARLLGLDENTMQPMASHEVMGSTNGGR